MTRTSVLRAAAVSAVAALALGGCSSGTDEPRTLARVDDWRQGARPGGDSPSLEVAYDATSAQRLWDENVPSALPDREGDPTEEGRYGDLADVDVDDQVVALWSGDQSGGCAQWLSGVSREEAGGVVLSEDGEAGPGDACSDVRVLYRTVVVLDRSAVPDEATVATTDATDDDRSFPRPVHLTAYPTR